MNFENDYDCKFLFDPSPIILKKLHFYELLTCFVISSVWKTTSLSNV